MNAGLSQRLGKLPPYLFVEIDRLKRQARDEGRDIIDLGIGDPDLPPPRAVLDALSAALELPNIHKYALDLGQPEFRGAIADWYRERFNVALQSDTEILPLIGSKEGIAHFPLAFVNPGDYTLVPDPCYPPYKGGTIFAGGIPYLMPLMESNGFLPDFEEIPAAVAAKAKILYLNYPNNPTSAVAPAGFYEKAIAFAQRHGCIILSDLAYSEMTYDGYRARSIFEAAGAREVAIEFHSLSKTFNMTGWRIGWACGNAALVAGLARVKSNIDSGIFNAIQRAGTVALKTCGNHVTESNRIYQERRDTLIDGLNAFGWEVAKPRATFYVWARVPSGYTSATMAQMLLQKADIVVTPGNGFGASGEGFVRLALTVSRERLAQALDRIRKVL